jgi:hypothetical protein
LEVPYLFHLGVNSAFLFASAVDCGQKLTAEAQSNAEFTPTKFPFRSPPTNLAAQPLDYFFLVAAAFLAEREREAAERRRAAARA